MATSVVRALPSTVDQYEQFEGCPGLRDELLYGEIVMSPQPKPLPQQVAKNVEPLLGNLLRDTAYVAQRDSNIKFTTNSMPAPDVFVVNRVPSLGNPSEEAPPSRLPPAGRKDAPLREER